MDTAWAVSGFEVIKGAGGSESSPPSAAGSEKGPVSIGLKLVRPAVLQSSFFVVCNVLCLEVYYLDQKLWFCHLKESNLFSLTLGFMAHINEGGVVEMKYTLNTKYMYCVIKTGTSKNLEMTRNGDLEFSDLSLILPS